MHIPRSLSKDHNDKAALHSPNWRESETLKPAAFYQPVPFFFTRTGCPLTLEGQYAGAHAFLIANGPSVLDFDLDSLRSRWCMTMNNGPKTFRGNANCTVDEPARFNKSTWLDPTIMKFMPMAHFEKPLWDNRLIRKDGANVQQWELSSLVAGDCPNVVGYRRNEKFHAPRWLGEETINWGNHAKYGGGRSVLLAAFRILYVLGFRKVYLLGVDFEMSEERRYHFPEERTASSVRSNMSTYGKLQQWFTELQPYFLKAGFIVHNCNPKSRLTAFPYLPYEEALMRSYAHLGNVKAERTEGMYQKFEDKKAGAQTSQGGEASRMAAASPAEAAAAAG